MTQGTQATAAEPLPLAEGIQGIVSDWSSDQRAFKNVPWGKAMMWIFLLSDTFIFSSFLISYMTVRMSTTDPWPNPSEVFALTLWGKKIPLILIAIMTFVLISSSGTMAMAVNFGYRKDRVKTFVLFLITGFHGTHVSIGVIFLIIVAIKVIRGDLDHERPGFLTGRKGKYEIVEIMGLYWHFVDLVWVFIFAFFYLW